MTNNKRKMNGLPMLRRDANFGRRLERKIAKFEKKHPEGMKCKLLPSRNPYFNPFAFDMFDEGQIKIDPPFLSLSRSKPSPACRVLREERIVVTEDPDVLSKEMVAMAEELGYKVVTLSEWEGQYGEDSLKEYEEMDF